MSNNVRFASIFAAIVLMTGTTTTARAQSVSPKVSGINLCKAMLPENYPLLPDEMREPAGKGATLCLATLNERIAAQEKLEAAAKNLEAAIADKKSSSLEILRAETDYFDALVDLHAADRAMHEPNIQASLIYFDLLIARKKAGIPIDGAMQADYTKWQKAMLAVENQVTFNETLITLAREARATRSASSKR